MSKQVLRDQIANVIGNILKAAYDIEQTKPDVIKVVDNSISEFEAIVQSEVSKVLDRLITQQSTCHDCIHDDEEMGTVPYVSLNAIKAELAALKEVKK
jgi:hypothetical protein